MKKIILVALISFSFISAPAFANSPPQEPYLIVYGRESCGICQRYMAEFKKMGLPYSFEIIDDPRVLQSLVPRMRNSGLNADEFGLPVIEVNGRLGIRPDIKEVAKIYRQGGKKSLHDNDWR